MAVFFTIAMMYYGIAPIATQTYHNITDPVDVINGTFLGDGSRSYYGKGSPDSLTVVWRHLLGEGSTIISRKIGKVDWKGAGWTGQPLMIREGKDTFLIQGAYDHHLKKINAANGELLWQYKFEDVIKGTGTFWKNSHEYNREKRYLILQGSRLGTHNYYDAGKIYSYRAVSFMSGKEKWRHNSKRTRSYSRDVDGSALIINDTAYIGLENSYFTVFNPNPDSTHEDSVFMSPQILHQQLLYHPEDIVSHKGNLVTESSVCNIGRMIYIASGSGHVWGFNMDSRKLEWDFYIGSDIDGSPVVTNDSCLLISVEKQYIKGKGGILKLDPRKKESEAVVWYFPVENRDYSSWEGGVIGTAGISDRYNDSSYAAFIAIDGYMYVVKHRELSGDTITGFDGETKYPVPVLAFKYKTGPSISTPVFTRNRLLACGYGGVFLFKYGEEGFELLDRKLIMVESTPFIWKERIYLASRNGYMYCLGR